MSRVVVVPGSIVMGDDRNSMKLGAHRLMRTSPPRPPMRYRPSASVLALNDTCTQPCRGSFTSAIGKTSAIGSPVQAWVTRPVMMPPKTSSRSIPVTSSPASSFTWSADAQSGLSSKNSPIQSDSICSTPDPAEIRYHPGTRLVTV